MKHIETFESFSSKEVEKIDEGLMKSVLNIVLGIPLAVIAFTITQFMDPRKVKAACFDGILNIYGNIDILIDTLENIHFNKADITDVEAKNILDKINSLKKVKKKYPTIDDYKKAICRWAPFINFKNRKYIKDQIMAHDPKKLTAEEVLKEIKKVYKLANREDIIGDVPERGGVAGQLDDLLNNYRNRR